MDLETYKKCLIETLPRMGLMDTTGVWELLLMAVWYPLIEAQGLPFATTNTTLYGQMDRVEILELLIAFQHTVYWRSRAKKKYVKCI